MNSQKNTLLLAVIAAMLIGFVAGQWLGLRQGVSLGTVSDVDQRLAVVGFTQSMVSALSEGSADHANAVANLWIDGELVALEAVYDQLDEAQQGLFKRTVQRIARHREEFTTGQRRSAEAQAVLDRFSE